MGRLKTATRTAMLEGGFDPQFELAGLLKDIRLVRQAIPESPALLDALEHTYATAADRGAAALDIAAVVRAFDTTLGGTARPEPSTGH